MYDLNSKIKCEMKLKRLFKDFVQILKINSLFSIKIVILFDKEEKLEIEKKPLSNFILNAI